MSVRKPVLALLIAALASASRPTAAADPHPSLAYVELLRRYHRGERAQAVAGLMRASTTELQTQFEAMRALVLAEERCATLPPERRAAECPNQFRFGTLPLPAAVRAAAMLHVETDSASRPAPGGVEQMRSCPGALSDLGGRYAGLLARKVATRDFAHRFLVMMVLVTQWDACFDHAERWGRSGLKLFPADAELLLSLGSVLEERATLTLASGRTGGRPDNDLAEAQRSFEEAISSDPGLVLPRVRLGRVLWRRGQWAAAQGVLAEAVARASDPRDAYLSHLFLGQAYEDSSDVDHARAEYRAATGLEPEAQSAAVALSRVLQLAGEGEASRGVLDQGLAAAGRREKRDPYWDYLAANAVGFRELIVALRQEAMN